MEAFPGFDDGARAAGALLDELSDPLELDEHLEADLVERIAMELDLEHAVAQLVAEAGAAPVGREAHR